MESLAILVKLASRWHTVVAAQVASLLDAVCFEAEVELESWCWLQMQAGFIIKVTALLFYYVALTCFDVFFRCLLSVQEVTDHLNHRVFLYSMSVGCFVKDLPFNLLAGE